MRVIAIGVGGAGCRIVNSLYAIDRKSSKVACVQALAVDVDEDTIKQLTALPENSRMCFSALDAGIPDSIDIEGQSAPIDLNMIVSRVQNMESGENDAIFYCCGLGGSMVDVAPHIIAGLRSSVVEPIFGLVTLPCLAEGERISGKAADDIEMLSSLLDGIILFDNETWHKKLKAQRAHLSAKEEKGFAEKIGLKKSKPPVSSAQATYRNLNEAIVRRIGLILRAGEFRADGGIDLAEVVLDSGEVLNTMKGMGFITIGYAVEKLPNDPLRFLSWLKPSGTSDEEQKKKASRIVELAKQAIYHEISTPCDLTSAHKALVLVAGPTQELSMRGFMTVRKWIDRSIAGLETRSGDYPIVSTKNVAIIVMLSGLENIPRITELKEIRSQSKPKQRFVPEDSPEGLTEPEQKPLRDDMITLPVRRSLADETGRKPPRELSEKEEVYGPEREPVLPVTPQEVPVQPEAEIPVLPDKTRQTPPRRPVIIPEPVSQDEGTGAPEGLAPSRRRVVVAREERDQLRYPPSHVPTSLESRHPGHKAGVSEPPSAETPAQRPDQEKVRPKETERQRIERELRRQRTVAIGQNAQKVHPRNESGHTARETHIIKRIPHQDRMAAENQHPAQVDKPAGLPEAKRTVIIGKRKITSTPEDSGMQEKTAPSPAESSSPSENDTMSVEIKDHNFQARDSIFEGKGVRKPSGPQTRDSILFHTELRPKKKTSERDNAREDAPDEDSVKETPAARKRTKSD